MQNKRLISLDLLRGVTILTMVLVNNPGDWDNVYPALLHAEWNGCKLADFVFPFFIFILGMAIPLANPNKEKSIKNGTKYLTRSLRIICLGLFLNFFNSIKIFNLEGTSLVVFRVLLTLIIGFALLGNYNFRTKKYTTILLFCCFMVLAFGTVQFQEVRLLGVLQRIGIVYFLASLTYTFFSTRVQIGVVISLLLGYWAMMSLIPIPGVGVANFEIGTNLAAWVDKVILKELFDESDSILKAAVEQGAFEIINKLIEKKCNLLEERVFNNLISGTMDDALSLWFKTVANLTS